MWLELVSWAQLSLHAIHYVGGGDPTVSSDSKSATMGDVLYLMGDPDGHSKDMKSRQTRTLVREKGVHVFAIIYRCSFLMGT